MILYNVCEVNWAGSCAVHRAVAQCTGGYHDLCRGLLLMHWNMFSAMGDIQICVVGYN